jgi:hypothetical protein
MKISELIELLDEYGTKHGNIEVKIFQWDRDHYTFIDGLEYDSEENIIIIK